MRQSTQNFRGVRLSQHDRVGISFQNRRDARVGTLHWRLQETINVDAEKENNKNLSLRLIISEINRSPRLIFIDEIIGRIIFILARRLVVALSVGHV